jgi:alcohol dehydrogenase (cytochrome c)
MRSLRAGGRHRGCREGFGSRNLYRGAVGAALSLVLLSGPVASQQPPERIAELLDNYSPVTAARLVDPEEGQWLSLRRTYDGWGYSPLDQITRENVHRLRPVWLYSTGALNGHQAPPMVNSGVMFVATPGNQVIALDAATGALIWRYRQPSPDGSIVLHPTTRGVALYGDKVFLALNHAVLVALDARTGAEVWSTTVADNSLGYYMTLAPLVADGKVMVGVSGGEMGIRGFVAAYDPDTGDQVWKAYTVPAPGEPGSETWPDGDEWMRGGAATWISGNYDPDTNLVYWGTGNGGPWMGDQRPGDNLYAVSTVAIDVGTGEIKGHFQYHQNDSWDYDENSPPLLIDYRRNGRTIRGLIDVARNGYLWFLERTPEGPIRFVEGMPYVLQNVFTSLDPVTGRPEINPAAKPGTGFEAYHCPSHYGGKNWPPVAFSPQTRLLYVPANNNLCDTNIGREIEYVPGRSYTGATVTMYLDPGADHVGELQAWDVDSGEQVWTRTFGKSVYWGSMLATAGGLLFSGGTNDRMLRAFDDTTGEVLWEFPTNSGILAPPTTFTVDGRQYLAVVSGWGSDARNMQTRINNTIWPGETPSAPEGGVIWVFALE